MMSLNSFLFEVWSKQNEQKRNGVTELHGQAVKLIMLISHGFLIK